jgi:hypothetical protein
LDGLIYACSMVMLDSARRKTPVPALARWLLGLGIAATLAANVAHGLGHRPTGAAVAAWPAVELVGSYELLMLVIRSSQVGSDGTPGSAVELLQEQAVEVFAEQLGRSGFRQSARSALSFTSDSREHNEYALTWPLLPLSS